MNTVKYLLRSLRENKKAAVLSMSFVTLEVVCECILPFVLAKLIDSSGVEWKFIAVRRHTCGACRGIARVGNIIGKVLRAGGCGILRESA